MAQQLAARSIPAILDLGFSKVEHRNRFRERARKAGVLAAVLFVGAPAEERRRCVEQRNAD